MITNAGVTYKQSMLVQSNMQHSYAEQNTVHYFAVKPVTCRLWLHLSFEHFALTFMNFYAVEE